MRQLVLNRHLLGVRRSRLGIRPACRARQEGVEQASGHVVRPRHQVPVEVEGDRDVAVVRFCLEAVARLRVVLLLAALPLIVVLQARAQELRAALLLLPHGGRVQD